MINTVSLLGFLSKSDEKNEIIRYLNVERNYKDNKGEFLYDSIPCISWQKKKKGDLYSFPEGSMVTVKGRVEEFENQLIIVAEEINYLGIKK